MIARTPRSRREPGDWLAFAVVALGPLLGFQVFPVPGFARLFLILPLLVLVTTYLTRPERVFPTWEWVLVGLLAGSVIWSDVPNYSAERLRDYLPVLVTVVVAAAQLRPARIVQALLSSFLILLASSAVVLIVDPSSRIRQGDFVLTAQFDKNTFGGLLGLSLVFLVAKPRRANLVLAPIIAEALALNYSVTAWITTTLAVLTSLVARWSARRLRSTSVAPALVVLVLIVAGAFGLLLLLGSSSALEAVGKDSTLSTRTQIWAACWHEIKAAPLIGHGAFGFLDPASGSPTTAYVDAQFTTGYQPPHPHNGLLDMWGQLGILGVIAYYGAIVTALRQGVRMLMRGDATSRAATTALLFVVLFGATEPTSLGGWLTVVLPCTIACKRAWALRDNSVGEVDARKAAGTGPGRLARDAGPPPPLAVPAAQ